MNQEKVLNDRKKSKSKQKKKNCQENNNQIDTHDKLKNYYHYMKQQRNLQRLKSKQQKQRRVSIEKKQRKKLLKQQLEQKKQQLSELKKRNELLKTQQIKAFEQAAIKEKELEDKIKVRNEKNMKNQQIRQERYKNAMKWLEMEKQNLNSMRNQAQYRRKTGKNWQSMERTKVTMYNQQLEKIKQAQALQNQPKSHRFNEFNTTLGKQAFRMIYKQKQNTQPNEPLIQQADQLYQLNTVVRASDMLNRKKKSKQEIKQLRERKSKQRGQSAQNKIKSKQQQAQFVEQCKKKSIQYNMMKISIGKSNQFAGIKPQTLSQMQINKQLRSQIQFEKLFFKATTLMKNKQKASKFDIIQARNTINLCNKSTNKQQYSHSIKSNNGTTLIPNYSQGKYSFQSEKIDAF